MPKLRRSSRNHRSGGESSSSEGESSDSDQVWSSNAEASSSNAQASSSNAQASSSNAQASSSNAQASSSNAAQQAQLEAPEPVNDTPTLDAVEQAAPDFTHLDVNAPLYNVGDDGNFEGESQEVYEATREALIDQGVAEPTDRQIRMAMIRHHVGEADTHRQEAQEGSQGDERVMGMMMLPEWFLGKNLTKDDMKAYRRELAELSEEFPEVMIQPGSAVWQERVAKRKLGKKGLGKNTIMHSDADVFFGGEQVHTSQKLFNGLDTNATQRAYGKHKGQRERERNTKWYANAPEREQKQAHNTDRYAASESNNGSRFEIGNRSFALEICGDHGSDGYRVRDEMHERDDFDPVDVHLMTSHGAVLRDRGAVMRDGGLGIQNDASRGDSFLHSATDGEHMTYAQPDWQELHNGGHKMADVGEVPDDAIYERHALERQLAMGLTKGEDERRSHLGTWTLPP